MRTMNREQNHRARARLALRAEQAFGLRSLPVRERDEVNADYSASDLINASVAQQSTPVASDAVDLFGTTPLTEPAQVILPASDAFIAPALSRDDKTNRLRELNAKEVSVCVKCRLC